MTPELLSQACGIPLARAQKWAAPITLAMDAGGITNRLRVAAFLAQVGHESGSFQYVRELGGNDYLKKYDTGSLAERLGNTPEADGDGQLYRGRGLIQITGRANYRMCSKALFNDDRLMKTPELLEQPEWACKSAVWFWNSRNLNSLADSQLFDAITRKINGGTNGAEDRRARYKQALSVLP